MELQFNLTLERPATSKTWLELRVAWDGTRSPGVKPHLLPPATNTTLNATLAPERAGNATLPSERGFDDWRIQSFAPKPGTYRLALNGTGDYVLTIRLLSLDHPHGAGPDTLPNLVTLLPIEVHYGACDPVEQQEQGAKRCLRFANGVANLGDGPLEVHLSYDRALFALAPALTEGRFVQRIYASDGSYRERDTGPATFHLAHRHWHFASLARFSLHPYDPATGLRGQEVTAHHKQGFCFLDWDKLDAPDSDPGAPSNAEQD
ncbi:MAG TPA: hypothetical protein VHI93_08280, partial [Candidatus Thermoplasmatota archaeon]|nr:hypothetical protein [Candidatus Thermoplasmatota archaeon]